MGYTPLFDSLTKGSLCGKWPDIGLWPVVLSMADWRGEILVTHQYIATVTGLHIDEVVACMERFCGPDPHSGSTNDYGRRLELLQADRDWGWKVVNIQKYRDKASGKDQVADGRNADKVRRYKDRHRQTPADTEGHRQTPTHTSDSDSDSDSEKTKNTSARKRASATDPDWFIEFRQAYPKRIGDQGWRKALKAANARIRDGYKPEQFIEGAKRYAAQQTALGKVGTEFVKQAATFLGPDLCFLENWPLPNGSNGQPAGPRYETIGEKIERLVREGLNDTAIVARFPDDGVTVADICEKREEIRNAQH